MIDCTRARCVLNGGSLCVICMFFYYIHYKYYKDTRLGLRVTGVAEVCILLSAL